MKKTKLSGGVILLLVLGAPLWISLLLSAFSVVLSLYISLWSIVASLWAGFGAMALGSLALLVEGICLIGISPIFSSIILIGAGLVGAGASILFFMGCLLATKGLVWLTKWMVKKMVGRKGKAV